MTIGRWDEGFGFLWEKNNNVKQGYGYISLLLDENYTYLPESTQKIV